MLPNTNRHRAIASVAAYRQNQLTYASPQDLLLAVYDAGVTACATGDADRAKAALVELVNSLNFDYQEISFGLLRMYNYCLDLTAKGQLEDVGRILSELRTTWAQAFAAETEKQTQRQAC